jgi:hypothetical protein
MQVRDFADSVEAPGAFRLYFNAGMRRLECFRHIADVALEAICVKNSNRCGIGGMRTAPQAARRRERDPSPPAQDDEQLQESNILLKSGPPRAYFRDSSLHSE